MFGTVTGIITLNKKSTADANCRDAIKRCNSAGVEANEAGKTFGTLSTIGFGVGVVGLAAGAYLLLTAESPRAAHSSSPAGEARVARGREGAVHSVNPAVLLAPGAGFVSLSGSF